MVLIAGEVQQLNLARAPYWSASNLTCAALFLYACDALELQLLLQ